MPVLTNTLAKGIATKKATIIKKQANICNFDLETLEELASDFELESDNGNQAYVRSFDGNVVLTIRDREENSIRVFYAENTDELFKKIDDQYLEFVMSSGSGSDFWDKWNSVLIALESCKIVDEEFDF